jgi:CHRD domain
MANPSRVGVSRRGLIAIAAGGMVAMRARAAEAAIYRARLSVVPIDVAMQKLIAGQGEATATLAGRMLSVSGNFSGLRSPATDAHIRRGPKGIPGPAILDLTIDHATEGKLSGSFALTPSQLSDLTSENLYIQINSERAPDGNLRGWLLP